MKNEQKITVYYDGLCRLCSKEINHYRKQKGAENIQFVDICGPTFDAAKEGLDPKQVHKIMHVRRADGTVATRVDAFIEIWKLLPKFRRLAAIAKNPLIFKTMNLGYTAFAIVRPWLPRRKANHECADSPYCEVNHG